MVNDLLDRPVSSWTGINDKKAGDGRTRTETHITTGDHGGSSVSDGGARQDGAASRGTERGRRGSKTADGASFVAIAASRCAQDKQK